MLSPRIIILGISLCFPQGYPSPQRQQQKVKFLFENEDFAVLQLYSLAQSDLDRKSLSGLVILKPEIGDPASFNYGKEVWAINGEKGGTQGYLWANSAHVEKLRVLERNPGYMVIQKSGPPINQKMFSGHLAEGFREAVEDDLDQISVLAERSAKGKSPKPEEQARAKVAFADLTTKSGWFSQSGPGDQPPDPMVDVNAHTKERGIEFGSCLVWYVPVAWENDRRHWKRFDKESSPTLQRLYVGNYMMWSQCRGGEGPKTLVSPGDDFKPEKDVDLVSIR